MVSPCCLLQPIQGLPPLTDCAGLAVNVDDCFQAKNVKTKRPSVSENRSNLGQIAGRIDASFDNSLTVKCMCRNKSTMWGNLQHQATAGSEGPLVCPSWYCWRTLEIGDAVIQTGATLANERKKPQANGPLALCLRPPPEPQRFVVGQQSRCCIIAFPFFRLLCTVRMRRHVRLLHRGLKRSSLSSSNFYMVYTYDKKGSSISNKDQLYTRRKKSISSYICVCACSHWHTLG